MAADFAGRVKVIYIDPPYNTGRDFVFRDNFRARRGPGNGGRADRHSGWLSMMLPRLVLARRLFDQPAPLGEEEARLLVRAVPGEELAVLGRPLDDNTPGEHRYASGRSASRPSSGVRSSGVIVRCAVEGSIDSGKVHLIERLTFVDAVRTTFTYVADYPAGDPRDQDGPETE